MNLKEQAIVVLAGGMLQNPKIGQWRTTHYGEKGDNFGTLGDNLRVEAANYLFKHNPNLTIITSGGKGQFKNVPDAPTLGSLIKSELVALGVAPEKIIPEENSGNTYQQLLEIIKIKRLKKLNSLSLISNSWHLPRIRAIIDHRPELKELKTAELISAEDICLKYDKVKWQAVIDKAYTFKDLKQRIKLEQQGIQDIQQGKYKFSSSYED